MSVTQCQRNTEVLSKILKQTKSESLNPYSSIPKKKKKKKPAYLEIGGPFDFFPRGKAAALGDSGPEAEKNAGRPHKLN